MESRSVESSAEYYSRHPVNIDDSLVGHIS
jgi:hypothetical protein